MGETLYPGRRCNSDNVVDRRGVQPTIVDLAERKGRRSPTIIRPDTVTSLAVHAFAVAGLQINGSSVPEPRSCTLRLGAGTFPCASGRGAAQHLWEVGKPMAGAEPTCCAPSAHDSATWHRYRPAVGRGSCPKAGASLGSPLLAPLQQPRSRIGRRALPGGHLS